jgi:hypothetical protein
MNSTARHITRFHIQQYPEYHYVSFSQRWAVWVWRQVVLLKLRGQYCIADAEALMTDCWSIHLERLNQWPETFCLVDLSEFEIQGEEFRSYLRGSWAHVLRREDLHVCLITGNQMKALIWHAIHVLMGTRRRIKIFRSDRQALAWVAGRIDAKAEVGNGA